MDFHAAAIAHIEVSAHARWPDRSAHSAPSAAPPEDGHLAHLGGITLRSATAAPRRRRAPHRDRHGARRRPPPDRSHRPAQAPPAPPRPYGSPAAPAEQDAAGEDG